MKQQADKKQSDRQFDVGDWVYVKLQPYRQTTVAYKRCLKLSTKFFGPYQVLAKVDSVVYKLALPEGARVHPIFHVSQLKLHVGSAYTQSQLPLLDETGTLVKEPISILDRRMVKENNQAVTEVLVQWRNTFPEDSTWESLHTLQQLYPHFHP